MEHLFLTLFLASFAGLYYLAFRIDTTRGWQLRAWLNGEVRDPRPGCNKPQSKKNDQIAELKKRIEVLEAIVTEPGYSIDQQIRRL
ncbi:hypothetical protein LJ739_12100 [Aestuariibacter halophilus]|uniref:Uncharacterized protein n=1 Tax=Fluctibacter halophilus TaxID=226011 RepID=A0ABS8G8W4_9ALTE|nr:hypothetical protein [Aestuariibacter halophilus]MCC2616985.1 hypothetical protein [Aestuariibacter halophilus]